MYKDFLALTLGVSMKYKRFKPKLDKLFWIILIPTAIFLIAMTVIPAIFAPEALFFTVPVDMFVAYFLISSLFGYAELREETLFIKFGFILKKEIPYSKIRGMEKVRRFYSDSMTSLKNSIEHVNIKYNAFDTVSISVKDNDAFIAELNTRI